jgi:hypothetical protein
LANIGSQCLPVPPGVFWEEIVERSIKESKKFEFQQTRPACNSRLGAGKAAAENMAEPEDVMMVEVTWMQPYLAYMVNKTLPEDVVKVQRIV